MSFFFKSVVRYAEQNAVSPDSLIEIIKITQWHRHRGAESIRMETGITDSTGRLSKIPSF